MHNESEMRTYTIKGKNFYARLSRLDDKFEIIQKKSFLGITIKQHKEIFDSFEKAEDRFLELKSSMYLNRFV